MCLKKEKDSSSHHGYRGKLENWVHPMDSETKRQLNGNQNLTFFLKIPWFWSLTHDVWTLRAGNTGISWLYGTCYDILY